MSAEGRARIAAAQRKRWAAARRSKPWSGRAFQNIGRLLWRYRNVDVEEYTSKMEDVLETYEKPYDPTEPVGSHEYALSKVRRRVADPSWG